MLTPNSYKRLPDFHPDRLTPAKSLTEAIPPEYDAKILLLRSDIISLLYTIFTEQDLIRQLEFTCVDRNAEILARDILIIAAAIEGLPDREWRRLWVSHRAPESGKNLIHQEFDKNPHYPHSEPSLFKFYTNYFVVDTIHHQCSKHRHLCRTIHETLQLLRLSRDLESRSLWKSHQVL